MAVAQPSDFEIDFARNTISGSAARFFVIIVKFIFTAIFEIKNYLKKFLGTKINLFSKPDFYKSIDTSLILPNLSDCNPEKFGACIYLFCIYGQTKVKN